MPETTAIGRCSTAPAAALGDRRCDAGRPMAGKHDPGHSGALGGAQQGAEVARIGDAVDDEQDGAWAWRRAVASSPSRAPAAAPHGRSPPAPIR